MIMTYNPDIHHRRSIRLKNFDYASVGAYFVTISVQNRISLLGKISGSQIKLSEMGEIAKQCWLDMPGHLNNVELDEFVVMPNHIHGIIVLTNICRGVQLNAPTQFNALAPTTSEPRHEHFSKISPMKKTLAVIIRTYKAAVTTICRQSGFCQFRWQRNYYEHIIRNDVEMNRIREYINNNAINWEDDEYFMEA